MTLRASVRKALSDGFALDVQLAAAPGITMLFGPSGSGKTTVLRCLAGLTKPDAGSIAIGSEVLFDSARGRDTPVQQRRIGYVFQHLALFPHLTVAANIAYGLHGEPTDVRRARVQAIAASLRIGHLLDRKPAAVSGGERQRTALARSLVTEPCLLLLDEPLSALDFDAQSRIIGDLRGWNDVHAIPILYVTHSHREVFALGDRVIALDQGRVVAEGIPHDVMSAPRQETLARVAGVENFLDGTIATQRTDAGTMQCRLIPSGVELEVPLSTGAIGSRVRIGVRAGDILLATQEPRGLSARNVLLGRVSALKREGPTVVATVSAGEMFLVHLTPGASEALRLAAGDRVWLILKTHSCRLLSI